MDVIDQQVQKLQARSQGSVYLKNRDQIIGIVCMIGSASSENTRVLGGVGGMLPRKILKFEVLKLAGNALKLSIPTSPRYFVSF